jgi:DNA-binding transcriptional MerR regulator
MTYVNVNGSVSMTSPARDVASATYTISELAAEFDITPRAIRFYEDMGLLEPSRDGRNRVYSVRDRTRLKLTLRGKRLGLSLQEIRQLVDMYESPADTAPQLTAFLAILQAHRGQLTQQLEDIRVTLEEIEQHEERARALLAEAARPQTGATE